VIVTVDATQLLAVASRLKGYSDRMPKVLADGLNEGGDKVRTRFQKTLQKQTGAIKYKTITEAVRTLRATPGASASYTLRIAGKGLPIKAFKVTAKRGPGGGVVAFPWDVEHKFKRSFVLGSGDGRAFKARTTSKRFPVRSLYGPSLPKEAIKGEAAAAWLAGAAELVPPIILKRMGRAFGA
jgi:hypothetical protein